MKEIRLEYLINCIDATAEYIDNMMETAREVSKKSVWAKRLIKQSEWTRFDVSIDFATSLYINKDVLIFEHSCIEYFYKITGGNDESITSSVYL